jgi:hypothetical protein
MADHEDLVTTDLSRLKVARQTGFEQFSYGGKPAGFDVLSFWQWASSDLVVNVVRGVLAEYIVAQALGIAGTVRDPWQPYDLKTAHGLTLEVKSGSYLQSWWQERHTDLCFSIGETTAWSADTNKWSKERCRQAQVYVFALLKHQDKTTIDPRALDQWEFYLVSTENISRRYGARKQLSMKALLSLSPVRVTYSELASAVTQFEGELLGTPTEPG